MIIELPSEIQMAIRIRAVKSNVTTGQVVTEAIQIIYPDEIMTARDALETLKLKEESK